MTSLFIGCSRPKGYFKPYAWLIMLWDWCTFSHVYIRFRAPSSEQWIAFQASGTHVNFYSWENFKSVAHVVKEYNFELDPESFIEFYNWALSTLGSSYGMKTVLGIPLKKMLKLKRNPFADGAQSWFCSELVARALKQFLHVNIRGLESAGPKKVMRICEELWKGSKKCLTRNQLQHI